MRPFAPPRKRLPAALGTLLLTLLPSFPQPHAWPDSTRTRSIFGPIICVTVMRRF